MTKHLRYLCTLLLCLVASVGGAEEVTFTAGTDTGETLVIKDGITVSMSTMSRTDNYRCYANSSMRVHSETVTITKIVITCTASGTSNYGPGKFSLDSNSTGSYSYSGTTGTWEGESNDISLTASAQVRITEIKITYTTGSGTEKCATPTFSLEENYYKGAQSVNISTATEGATIYFTTDGSTPTTSSNSGTTVTISETCTLKAIAVKEGLNESALGSATYAIVDNAGTQDEPFTVADARNILTAFPSKTFENVYVSGIISQIDSYNSTYKSITYWISDNGTTTDQFEVYSGKGLNGADFNAVTDLIVGSEVTVKGKIKKYNSTYEFDVSSEIVSLTPPTYPVINVVDDEIELEHDDTNGEIAYTITNPTTGVNLTAATEANWILNITVGEGSVTFTTTANEGTEDRTATITLSYTGAESKTVTVTQKHYVADFATLPFSFNGGKDDIANIAGLTENGLGTDYSSAPKLKFDGSGDYIILHFNERPGKLTFDIKNNSFSGGTFKVQTSEDGVTYSDLEIYTEITGTQNEEFNNLGENVRYIKWVYTTKASGNVALGNIALAQYSDTPAQTTITAGTLSNVSINELWDGDLEGITLGDNVTEGTLVYFTLSVDEGYNLESVTVLNANNEEVTLTENQGSWSFTMPNSSVTINATATSSTPATGDQYSLFTGDLVEGDYIIYYDGKAMNTTVTSNRLGYEVVTPANNIITTDNAAIVWHIAQSGNYWTIYNAAEGKYAAATSSNNQAQMLADGKDNKALWTVSDKYDFINKANSRYLRNNGTYGFACYASGTGGALSLYKKVGDTPQPETVEVTISAAATDGSVNYGTLYYSNKNLTVPEGVTAYTASVSNGSLTLSAVTGAIPANTGVVLKTNSKLAENTTFTFTEATEGGTVVAGNMLLGTDDAARTTAPEGSTGTYKFYALSLKAGNAENSVGFYYRKGCPNGEAFTNGEHKAYLAVPVAQAKGMSGFAFGDETDGIDSLTPNPSVKGEGSIYNLAGQRVNKAKKGVYIVNGRKVVIK